MGQKVNPISLRLGIIKTWDSRWFKDDRNYGKYIVEDHRLRKFLKQKLYHAGISRIVLERAADKLKVELYTARPGLVIGKKGAELENLKKEINKRTDKEIILHVHEVRKPEIDAQLVAENVALQLERRIHFRRAIKKAVSQGIKLGAKGVKVQVSGRLGGAEMARTEWHREGRVPLHTLRADIDYGLAESLTTYGIIGVKVWIFKGEVLEKEKIN